MDFKTVNMKQFFILCTLLASFKFALTQKISIVPHTGINLSAFGYRAGGKDPASILTYPKFNNINPVLGVDIMYEKGKFIHALGVSSQPFGISFKGDVKQEGTNQTAILFSHAAFDRQFMLSYQLFVQSRISKTSSKRPVYFNYGMGLGVGFNRSKNFYSINNIPRSFGGSSLPAGHFYAYEYNRFRTGIGYFLKPEIGFIFYNKKKKPFLNTSLFYNIGLTEMESFKLKLQYGNLFTTYFKEENQILKTRGSVFGFKIGVPVKLFEIKKHAKLKL